MDAAIEDPKGELPSVETRGLTRRFGDFAAVNGATLAVNRGEISV
jgi:ABC-type branched-subunit amino acid transport system ATPase component